MPASATFSAGPSIPEREERGSAAEAFWRASSQASLLAPMSNSGHRIVTLLATREGVVEGVARETRTGSNMWFFSVSRSWIGRRGGRASRFGEGDGRPGCGAWVRGRRVMRGM